MANAIDEWTQDIHQGDAAETLAKMPESSVHMAMCSPPYYGLRDYDEDGQIGLEESLDAYIDSLVDVATELRRVLRDDGSWWLNLGDSYAQSGRTNHDKSGTAPDGQGHNRGHAAGGFVSKQKMLVPHRTAIALQDAGWIVRNDVTWVKPNPMPQSVKDRLNTTTEQIFHLVPEPNYWYDLDAIREPHATEDHHQEYHSGGYDRPKLDEGENVDGVRTTGCHPAGKNPGDVFEVTTKPFPDAHFAVYPPELCEKPIKATCPPEVCAECGAGYERETEHTTIRERFSDKVATSEKHEALKRSGVINDAPSMSNSHDEPQVPKIEHKGWRQPCECDTDDTNPGIALDPFAGAGTTCLVAKRLGRRFIGLDLNPDYVAMAQKRVGVTVDEPKRLLDDDETQLAAFADGKYHEDGDD